MYIGLHVKYRLFLSDFNISLIISKDFRKILILNLMKILLVGVELFHADGCTDRQAIETDTTKLIVAFRNFEKGTKSNLIGPLAGSATHSLITTAVRNTYIGSVMCYSALFYLT